MDLEKMVEGKAKAVFDALIGAAVLIGGTCVIAKDVGGALKRPVIGQPPIPMASAYFACTVVCIVLLPIFPLPLFVSAAFIGVQLIKHARYNAAVKEEAGRAAEQVAAGGTGDAPGSFQCTNGKTAWVRPKDIPEVNREC